MYRKDLCEGGRWVTGKIFQIFFATTNTKTCDEFSNFGAWVGEIFLNTSSLWANSQWIVRLQIEFNK